ncbi:MAG: histidine phosphatase family protein [Microbacteriaceae bacterium]|nr:histidine phosphatase family protein [Microbacteriaceae bacterium]
MSAVEPTLKAFTSRIVLVRHGETEWSLTGRHTSVTDLPLTETGQQQARNVGVMLAGRVFGLVLSSPRERAKHTAELAGYGSRVILDPNLVEWDYGAYEGLTSPQIVEQLGMGWNLWRDGVPSGNTPGEHRDDIRRRTRAVIERALPVLNRGEDVLLVAHGHFLRGFAAAWLGLPAAEGAVFSLSTGSVSELGFEHERQVIFNWNGVPATAAR